MMVVLGKIEFHPDDLAAATALMLDLTRETRQEPECMHYAFGQDLAATNRFWLSEQWRSEAALVEHFKLPHMAAFRAGLSRVRVLHLEASSYGATAAQDLIGRRTE